MIIHLSNRIPLSEAVNAFPVGAHDGIEGLGHMLPKPTRQRGPNVEAHLGVVVVELDDVAGAVEDPGPGIGRVALFGDAAVPVVVGCR